MRSDWGRLGTVTETVSMNDGLGPNPRLAQDTPAQYGAGRPRERAIRGSRSGCRGDEAGNHDAGIATEQA